MLWVCGVNKFFLERRSILPRFNGAIGCIMFLDLKRCTSHSGLEPQVKHYNPLGFWANVSCGCFLVFCIMDLVIKSANPESINGVKILARQLPLIFCYENNENNIKTLLNISLTHLISYLGVRSALLFLLGCNKDNYICSHSHRSQTWPIIFSSISSNVAQSCVYVLLVVLSFWLCWKQIAFCKLVEPVDQLR